MPLTPLPSGAFRRLWRNIALMLALLFLLLLALWLTLPRWLPTVAKWALPANLHLQLEGRPGWRQGAIQLPAFSLTRGECLWLRSDGGDATHRAGAWRLHLGNLQLDTACVAPSTPAAPASDPFVQWQRLPAFTVHIDHLTVAPWQAWGGGLTLTHAGTQTRLIYQGDKLAAELTLDDRQLTLQRLAVNGMSAPVVMQGKLTLAPGYSPKAGPCRAG